ncbi:MAG: hypothetical protein M1168_02885 [Candidatus Marsarchaeota archaeon]|nr:hypothetical protein [Candidatus Marsarchaeota archaeon]MCL5094899.1 hypothetical protein [Candidatus Marsarchaeota archaeon]
MAKNHEQISAIFLIVTLLLILFVLFIFLSLRAETRMESLFATLVNTTANIKPVVNVQNIYPNAAQAGAGNASIAVYVSQFYYNYHLIVKIKQGNKTISSIPLDYSPVIPVNETKTNSSSSNYIIPVFQSRQLEIIFTRLNAFTLYNVSISGTIAPLCTKICPMAGSSIENNLINSSNISNNSAVIIKLSNNVTSSSIPANSLSIYTINSVNSIIAPSQISNITPNFIIYIHKYELVTTNANGTLTDVYFSV